MIRVFHKLGGEILKVNGLEGLESVPVANLLWVDLQFAEANEKEAVESKLNIKLPSTQEAAEIESSSRYFETYDTIYLNTSFLTAEKGNFNGNLVSFVLRDEILVTQRNADLKTFAETVKKIKSNNRIFRSGLQVLISIFETKIDHDADYVEGIAKDISSISKEITLNKNLQEDLIIRVSSFQETTMLLRENINDTQRSISSLLKSDVFPPELLEKLRIMIKDAGSLLHHTDFSFERLEYLQNTFLGLLNIEQNKIIKIFTVVSVVFMPPTLIASIYGMNFKSMPELSWSFGYPVALLLLILSSLGTLLIFKKKKWL